MTAANDYPGLGTRLRTLLDLLDADLATIHADLGLTDFRSRFTPAIRALAQLGPSSIRTLAETIGVTHSAASQTVAQLHKRDLVELRTGEDARQRIVHLTTKARGLLPTLEIEWAATEAARAELEAELSFPLTDLLAEFAAALERRPLRARILDAAAKQRH